MLIFLGDIMRASKQSFFNRLGAIFIFVLMSSVIGTSLQGETILVVKTQKFLDQYEKALLGCLQELKARGYKDNLKLLSMDTTQSPSNVKSFDIVYAIGAESAAFAREAFKDKPIVFSMVLDPAGRKLVQNLSNPEGNITGVSLDVPIREYLRVLKCIVSKPITLGVIYDPVSSKKFVADLQALAPEMNIKVVAVEVSSSYEVPNTLDQLLPKIDFFWLLLDRTVATRENIPLIIERCFQKKIGVYGFSPLIVKAGALVAPLIDFEDIGRQSAGLLVEIMANKEQKKIPSVVSPRITKIALNSTVATSLGIKITPEVQKMVKEFY